MVSSTTGIAANEGLGVAEWGSRLSPSAHAESLPTISFFQNSSCSNFYAQADVIVSTRRGAKWCSWALPSTFFRMFFFS